MTIKAFLQAISNAKGMQILWRVVLASVLGFIFLSVFIAGVASLGSALFHLSKATLMLWLMLIGIVLYCCLVMWIFASNKLMRCSVIIIAGIVISSAALYAGDMLHKNHQPVESR
ncbi:MULTISPECIES: hypothetical protein [Pseudoalteromonas]|uniref:DUF3649 domain-containing protein n=1 Tax=Pseudoalteromonas haloplanktis TaxID=228 RepID=A0ABU1BFW8_PSEHA|nr:MULTISPECIES: hypothetical protein [Pseudoalteromonas]MCF6144174.1 hypothetical protein [Pseudoalteromonas mariniglutinosa NCIMB 1770]MDQ9092641.1 hypothetical protein [Pseudoalteromonas haloplanktis]TMN69233.1 hypothetical protein CWB85_17875 [Pseudoalteromonas sp. S1727]BDF96495.1 hypothetical protein KAN5_33330 [Pseudoalteromonas sp. KAN5]